MAASRRRRQDLFGQLRQISRSTYAQINDGRARGVEQHEETLTECLLLALTRANEHVHVRTFSRHEESRQTGADWAWWWEGDRKWFGSLVQAKKVSQRTGRFDFGYRPRASLANPSPDRQIDLLMDAARDLGLPPMYVLYGGDELDLNPDAWLCSGIAYDVTVRGASVLPAGAAAWLLGLGEGATHQRLVNELARPLPCLACSCGLIRGWQLDVRPATIKQVLGFPDGTSDVDLAFRAAGSYLTDLVGVGPRATALSPQSPEVTVTRQGVRDRPPGYVIAAIEGYELPDDEVVPERVVVVRRDADLGVPQ